MRKRQPLVDLSNIVPTANGGRFLRSKSKRLCRNAPTTSTTRLPETTLPAPSTSTPAAAASPAASPAAAASPKAAASPADSASPAAAASPAGVESPPALPPTLDQYAALCNAYVANDVPMPVVEVIGQLQDRDYQNLGNVTVKIVTSVIRVTSVKSRSGAWVRVGKYHAYGPEDHVYDCPNCMEMPANGVYKDVARFLRHETTKCCRSHCFYASENPT